MVDLDWSEPGASLPSKAGVEQTLLIQSHNGYITPYRWDSPGRGAACCWLDNDEDEMCPTSRDRWVLINNAGVTATTPEPRVIQITAAAGGSSDEIVENLFALCDDGSIWERTWVAIPDRKPLRNELRWVKIESIEMANA